MQIKKVVDKVFELLSSNQVTSLPISDYNKRYIQEYIDNRSLFSSLYIQLMEKSVKRLNKPVEESVFIDYGGGCGILSLIAYKLKFRQVVYNDIYEVSVNDVSIISKHLNIKLDALVCGGVEELLKEIYLQNIKPDLICSLEVIEHIYDVKGWFSKIKTIDHPFSLCFMTSANGSNPFINRRLEKIHFNAEFVPKEKVYGWKERDTTLPFLEMRKKIIKEYLDTKDEEEISLLAETTRGLMKDDIEKVLDTYNETGVLNYTMSHPSNTCDPLTGNWAEQVLDLKDLKSYLEADGQTNIRFTNSNYGYSHSKLTNIAKFVMNLLLAVLGRESLFLSPNFTLEMDYKK